MTPPAETRESLVARARAAVADASKETAKIAETLKNSRRVREQAEPILKRAGLR